MPLGVSQQKGFTFLEIVAALAVLAIGILAVITLFPIGVQNSKRASERTRAALLAYQELQHYRVWGYAYLIAQRDGVYRSFVTSFPTTDPLNPAFSTDPYFLYYLRHAAYAGATAGTNIQEVKVTAVWPSTQSDPLKRRELKMSTLISER